MDLQTVDPSFIYIYDAVNKIPGLKTKFHAAFNMRSMNFINMNHRCGLAVDRKLHP